MATFFVFLLFLPSFYALARHCSSAVVLLPLPTLLKVYFSLFQSLDRHLPAAGKAQRCLSCSDVTTRQQSALLASLERLLELSLKCCRRFVSKLVCIREPTCRVFSSLVCFHSHSHCVLFSRNSSPTSTFHQSATFKSFSTFAYHWLIIEQVSELSKSGACNAFESCRQRDEQV